MNHASLEDAAGCDGLVADFSAIPAEWEALLADAAVQGRMVYQVKQLFESLTGRVAIDHLSENSFGSLVPARGYFHLKSLGDLFLALLVLPFVTSHSWRHCACHQTRQPGADPVPAASRRTRR